MAFQILNDLNDWQGDQHNKLHAGGDALGGRPTILFALAMASLKADEQAELMRLTSPTCEMVAGERVRRIEQLYRQAKAFDQASRLIDKHQQRALEVVRDVQPEALQRLMIYLVDTVLERSAEAVAPVVPLTQIQSLPMPNTAR